MKRYRHEGDDTGVEAYRTTPTSIFVKFRDSDRVYEYSNASAGTANVAKMKRLAAAGKGLSTFITRHVRDRYVR
ncbi:hypothetical protein [Pseudoxanthomonas sp. UTMC 1351]|uniref:hypothetical protein n=1 Tax=Pseudoxanthomonas sp. UTMC 1351 TaxID=2695853 RepID=UPI0034CEDB7D